MPGVSKKKRFIPLADQVARKKKVYKTNATRGSRKITVHLTIQEYSYLWKMLRKQKEYLAGLEQGGEFVYREVEHAPLEDLLEKFGPLGR